jgi:single-stranded DNA-binding protein
MNAATISGLVAGMPHSRRRIIGATTTFDLDVLAPGGERVDRFHVIAYRDAAGDLRNLKPGDSVTVTGHLRSEPWDMPDRSVWYRVELVAHAITHP